MAIVLLIGWMKEREKSSPIESYKKLNVYSWTKATQSRTIMACMMWCDGVLLSVIADDE